MERQGLEPVKRVGYWEYDFAKDGGAIGTITLRGDALPSGAVITNGMIHVHTAVVSAGAATVSFHQAVAQDIRANTLQGVLLLNALLDVIPAGTAATSIRNLTQGNQLKMIIGVAALTAGKIVVALEYYA